MAKVLIRFTDKETRKTYQVGDDYTGRPDRIKGLTENGYLESDKTEPVKAKKPKKTK